MTYKIIDERWSKDNGPYYYINSDSDYDDSWFLLEWSHYAETAIDHDYDETSLLYKRMMISL